MPMLLALTALLATTAPRVEVVVPASIHAEPITGRVFVFFSHDSTPEPRLQSGGMVSVPFFGQDVDQLAPGTPGVIDEHTQGYPLQSITSLPAGDYYAQAIVSVYTKFARADGHTIWAHMDEWEGQQFNRAPGTLVSDIQRVHVDATGQVTAHFEVSRVLPPVEVPADTRYVKHVKIQSQILTKWWGHPIYLGAVVLLPKGYEDHPSEKYPAIWEQGHFTLQAPFGFTFDTESTVRRRNRALGSARESGAEFAKSWLSDGFPQFVAFRILHPSPYYDDSYAVNSANNGPYGDAIMQELIPYLETHYRVIREPYARLLTGGSTGGWEAMALQVYHPEFFGGTWVFYPDPVDFRRYEQVNIYNDTNAFVIHRNEFITQWRPSERTVDGQVVVQLHEENQLNNTRGSRRRGGENFAIWEATFGPTDKDGYPAPIWNDTTGVINRDVANAWREGGYDIRDYLSRNWTKIGPELVGKIHVFCGDEDNYYLNLAVYLLQDYLEKVKNPTYGGSFDYGRPLKPHGWQPMTDGDLVRQMSAYVAKHRPATQ